jgi:guanosine-3',5'-bis(diphosphate) 3'-pyrophosphohydrolase
MEQLANNGIAAHWLYKANNQDASVGSHARARQWVQGLLELQQNAGNSLEFIENVKIDLFPEEVYVFTPKGKIMELPLGSTAVDFAYAVHTDIGNSCVGCRINRRLAALSQPLQSGQTIEIITAPGANPNPSWLDIIATSRARSQIRHYLKHLKSGESVELGQRLLNKSLVTFNSSLEDITSEQKAALVKKSGNSSFQEILEEVGLGNRVAYLTARQLLDIHEDDAGNNMVIGNREKPLVIAGTEGMMINFAKCCNPIPGDDIGGHITAGRGVVVHLADCRNYHEIQEKDKEGRSVTLRWHDNAEGEYRVELKVEVEQQRGIIASLANKVNSLDGSIESIKVEERDSKSSIIHIFLAVSNRIHLARIIRRIRVLKSVVKVVRVKR